MNHISMVRTLLGESCALHEEVIMVLGMRYAILGPKPKRKVLKATQLIYIEL